MRITILLAAWLLATAINAHETALWFEAGKGLLPYVVGVLAAMDIVEVFSPRAKA